MYKTGTHKLAQEATPEMEAGVNANDGQPGYADLHETLRQVQAKFFDRIHVQMLPSFDKNGFPNAISLRPLEQPTVSRAEDVQDVIPEASWVKHTKKRKKKRSAASTPKY